LEKPVVVVRQYEKEQNEGGCLWPSLL